MMKVRRIVGLGILAIAATCSAAHARPCSKDIDLTQARFDARLEAIAKAGPFLPTTLAANLSAQPTPYSMAKAEERMHEISANKVDAIRDAMAKARSANAAGNEKACERALADVRHLMRH